MKNFLTLLGAGSVAAAAALLCASPAIARDNVDWSVSIGSPGYYGPPPVVYSPPPVYVQPQPVYVPPPPVYVAPAPVVQYRYDRWRGNEWREHHRHHGHHHHRD